MHKNIQGVPNFWSAGPYGPLYIFQNSFEMWNSPLPITFIYNFFLLKVYSQDNSLTRSFYNLSRLKLTYILKAKRIFLQHILFLSWSCSHLISHLYSISSHTIVRNILNCVHFVTYTNTGAILKSFLQYLPHNNYMASPCCNIEFNKA